MKICKKLFKKLVRKPIQDTEKDSNSVVTEKFSEKNFLINGFYKFKNVRKKICVEVDTERYEYDYESNVIYEIPKVHMKFAICAHLGEYKKYLFLSKGTISKPGMTSPYRTFYEGLMKKPFDLCFPLDEVTTVATKKGICLRFWIENKVVK